MRFIISFFSGVLGMLVGWAGLFFLVISLAGPDRDGGIGMAAFSQIGPIGGFIGFIIGVWLFGKIGVIREATSRPTPTHSDVSSPPVTTHISPTFALAVISMVAALAWWGWYVLIR